MIVVKGTVVTEGCLVIVVGASGDAAGRTSVGSMGAQDIRTKTNAHIGKRRILVRLCISIIRFSV